MKKSTVIAIPSPYLVITTIIVYALLVPIFFEMDNALGEGAHFVVNDADSDNKASAPQLVEDAV